MSESNVAQDQIKAYVDRILRMKEEAKAINADIREIYNEAKSSGFDKTVLGKLVTYVEKRAADKDAVLESESIFDLYLTAYDSAVGNVGTKRATHTHAPVKADAVAAIRTNKTLAIVEAAVLEKSKTQPTKAAGQAQVDTAASAVLSSESRATSLPGAEGAEDRDQITEPQPSQPAGSDLTSLAPHEGQVAPIQPETADEDPSVESANAGGENVAASENAQDETETTDDLSDAGKSAGASASAAPTSKYADPGIVVWEHTAPEPVRRHRYSEAFGILGQDLVVIDDDIAGAKSDPIVRIGNEILDGWARYNVASGMIGGSGMSTEYPVMQYAGTDPLLDCIRLNVAGRVLSPKDKQTVAHRLIAIEPKRKADILKALAELAA